ncbi:hypothetical protein SULAR_06348 [Sulfurovum sp. AR]|nr:hypothetical protein SULAR_06348 [Sulfurovum sp. AR]
MHNRMNRSAFSLLELIFVIVILGIVSSLGAEIIANVYQSYVLQRAQHRASLKTELVATEVANRLRYAIPGTVIRRVGKTGTPEELSETMASSPDAYTVLQWVAYDGDSFEAISSATDRKPGWSGFCDINTSTTNSISTPGSNLGLASTIIGNLSKSATPVKSITNAYLYFPYDTTAYDITTGTGETITLGTNAPRIFEHYKLSWSSYALVVENGDLYLYYNFSPTPAAAIGNIKSLLLKNVTNFKFQGAGRTTRFKVCKQENIGEDFNITSCKEKAVF